MKQYEDFSEVVKRSKIDFVEEFRKTLQDEITKTIEEADKEMINNCKKLSHENMEKFSTNAYDEIITFGVQ